MKVMVFGGDGFCGWPRTLHLSKLGMDLLIVDNLSRRKIDVDLECDSLTPIRPINERLKVWREVSGKKLEFVHLDVAREYERLVHLIQTWQPDAIIHFAEQ